MQEQNQEQNKQEQVSAVVNAEGQIVSKIYTRHGDALRYLKPLQKSFPYYVNHKAQRFNLVPDESFEYKDK